MRWFVDGNNVMGSVPDGWWNDPDAAAARLAQRVARWCRTHDDAVVLVFDGAPRPSVSAAAGGNLEVDFAPPAGGVTQPTTGSSSGSPTSTRPSRIWWW